MKILIERDSTAEIDIPKIISVLDNICSNLKFVSIADRIINEHTSEFIDLGAELIRAEKRFDREEYGYYVYVTSRPYDDNYYYRIKSNIAVLSIGNWQYYTPLPIENGILYFLASFIVRDVDHSNKHIEAVGCIYDFLEDKTSIDRCLKMGFICEECRNYIDKKLKNNNSERIIFDDVISILNAVANTSRWNESIFSILENEYLKDLNWSSFENFVADYYRMLGGEVKQNINIAGFQIDVFVSEKTASGETVNSVIECKFWKDKVGNRTVNDFARLVSTMKEAGEADNGVIVSYAGFTKDAHLAGKHSSIRLLQYSDLLHKLPKISEKNKMRRTDIGEVSIDKSIKVKKNTQQSKKIFVIMPFSSDLDDLFYYGIRGAIQQMDAVCKRVDQIEFTGAILEEIYDCIRNSHIIIAEVTQHNPNVYYELGYAHALNKPVILITGDISKCPFDIKGFNHIVYNSIKELEEKLKNNLNALIQ